MDSSEQTSFVEHTGALGDKEKARHGQERKRNAKDNEKARHGQERKRNAKDND